MVSFWAFCFNALLSTPYLPQTLQPLLPLISKSS
jgi:hypothetical protein